METFPFVDRQECWLGKINEFGRPTDDNKNTVFIERWHTNQLKNVTGTNNPGYKKWAGTKVEPGDKWINPERILYTFKEFDKKR